MKKQNSLILFLKFHFQHNKILIFLNFVLFIILIISLNFNIFYISYNFKVNKPAPFDVVAEKDFKYLMSKENRDNEERIIKEKLDPVFDLDMTVYSKKEQLMDEIANIISDPNILTKEEKLDKLKSILSPLRDDKDLEENLIDYEVLYKYARKKTFVDRVKKELYKIYINGVYQKNKKDIYDLNDFKEKTVEIKLKKTSDTQGVIVKTKLLIFSDFLYANYPYVTFLSIMRESLQLKARDKRGDALVSLLFLMFEGNLKFNKKLTLERIQSIKKIHVTPIYGSVSKGIEIVGKNKMVTQDIKDKLKVHKVIIRKGFLKKLLFAILIGLFFIVILNVSLRIGFPNLFKDLKKVTLIYMFLIFNILFMYLAFNLLRDISFPIGIIFPIGFTIYILVITMDRRIAFIINVAITLLYAVFIIFYKLGNIKSGNIYSILYILILGTFINLLASNINRRDQIIRSSLFAAIPYILMTFLYVFYFSELIKGTDIKLAFLWSILNPIISAVISIGLIPVFEKVFNMITPFRLMELSNLSNQILSDMHLLAPGTYHHSMLVAHLVESACKDIGANYLLARVGTLYHDIGKLTNPKYFAENLEFGSFSIHEEISPQFSASILKKHVIEGMRMAKELGLPEEIVSFIPEHHGTSKMEFFYHKAVESKKDDEEIDIGNYLYSGPKPRSKETAILMLADGIEASVRSLKSKRYDLIEEKIAQVINSKINNGQFSDCPLTLRDIQRAEIVFKKLMFAYYHVRPTYPSDKENQNEKDNGHHKNETHH